MNLLDAGSEVLIINTHPNSGHGIRHRCTQRTTKYDGSNAEMSVKADNWLGSFYQFSAAYDPTQAIGEGTNCYPSGSDSPGFFIIKSDLTCFPFLSSLSRVRALVIDIRLQSVLSHSQLDFMRTAIVQDCIKCADHCQPASHADPSLHNIMHWQYSVHRRWQRLV